MAHHLERARLTSTSPPRGPGKTPLGDEAFPVGCYTETIVWTVLVTDCGGFAVSFRRFHTPIRSALHSRKSPSIGSSLAFEGHITQSCGADIHPVHSFLADAFAAPLPGAYILLHVVHAFVHEARRRQTRTERPEFFCKKNVE